MNNQEAGLQLIQYLLQERPELSEIEIPQSETEQFRLLRALMNTRLPGPVPTEILALQDAYLQEEISRKGIVSLSDLRPVEKGIYLWQGDITRLQCDAIVNAANSQMLGCFCPNHGCIDNTIHTFAGMQLRQECARLMDQQGHPEPTGQAKITSGYNLPARYVIHTVGPIIKSQLTKQDEQLLESCYRNVLELAYKHNLRSVAFCCISTGEYHFPNDRAAQIAVKTVREFLKDHEMEVIFNVFKETDKEIYQQLLG